jgi:UDP-glucose 4-epimerase
MPSNAETSPAGGAAQLRIALTGATGMLGRHLLDELAAWPNIHVLALIRSGSKPFIAHPAVACECVDFRNRNTIASAFKVFQPTTVIHCAATGMQQPRPGWEELVSANVTLSTQLCELTADIPGCHFVFVGSGLAYRDQGRPLREEDLLDSRHPYAATKAAADQLVQAIAAEAGLPLTVVRPFSFTGAGDSGTRLFPSLLRAAVEQRPLALSPGDQVRDHCAVNDVARGIALAVAKHSELPAEAQVFNFGSGSTATLRQLIEGVVEELGLAVTLQFGARAYTPHEPMHLVANTTRAQQLLQWQSQTNLAYAVWQVARESFPTLNLKQPRRSP